MREMKSMTQSRCEDKEVAEAKRFKQGDRVRVIGNDYPGLFKVVHPFNLTFDEETQQAGLVVVIEPVDVDEFIARFCKEGLPADIKGFEIAVKPEYLELVIEPEYPQQAEYWGVVKC